MKALRLVLECASAAELGRVAKAQPSLLAYDCDVLRETPESRIYLVRASLDMYLYETCVSGEKLRSMAALLGLTHAETTKLARRAPGLLTSSHGV